MVLKTPNVQDVLLCTGVLFYWRESPDSLLLLSGELSVPQMERASRMPVGLDRDTLPSLPLTAALWGTCLLWGAEEEEGEYNWDGQI